MNITKNRIAFSSLCMGFFMVILDVTIVNVTLPTIATYFHANLSQLQWVVAGYTLMFACFLLIVGSLTDYFGAKKIFQIGLLSFSITSLACGLSTSISLLIFFRFLQGIAGALLLPPSLALINLIYDDEKKRAQAFGIWAALGGVACASGPFLGGVITSLLSWRWIFVINVFIGLTSYFLIAYSIDRRPAISHEKPKFDLIGQIIGIITMVSIAFALINMSIYGWKNIIIIISFAIFLLSLIAFIKYEKKISHPMIPFSLFKNRTLSMALIVAMILNLCFYGSLFSFPFYFERIRHYSVFYTGLALLPLPALAVFGSYISGKITAKIGARRVIIIGLSMAAIGYLSLLTIRETGPAYPWIMISFLIIGFGVSFTTPAMTFAAVNAVEKSRAGIAAAILNTVNQVGSLIGVAVFGTIIALSHSLVFGLLIVLLTVGLLFLITAFLSARIMS
jgi:MFS transporter, DHA2 family, methylenomycin A resistance protein